MNLKLLSLASLLCLCSICLSGQDVENSIDNIRNVGREGLKISGGINLDNQFYAASGITSRRDNYQWGINANLNLSLAGINAPFSFTFSDANRNFRLPSYTFTGISPSYKWITLHAGDRSMAFSPYTMSGISFRGVGLELTPGKFQFSTFYGRLNRALAADLDALGNLNGLYRRNGYGARLGYSNNGFSYALNFFGASDKADELEPEEEPTGVEQVDNKVYSLEVRQRLSKNFSVNGEVARSDFNRNKLLSDEGVKGVAYNLNAAYSFDKIGTNLTYERITRGFRTLGALFFNNDTENITAGMTYALLKGKMNLGVRAGLERTNLDGKELESSDRFIASTNINYRPNNKWSYSFNYSNFRNDTKLRVMSDIELSLDSIFLAQVTQAAGFVVIHRLGESKNPKIISLVTNLQRANNIINDTIDQNSVSQFQMLTLTYAGSTTSKWRYNFGFSYNQTELVAFKSTLFTPSAGVSKSFFNNQLTTSANTSFSTVVKEGTDNNNIFNIGLNLGYQLKNAHRLTLGSNFLSRFGASNEEQNFSEFYAQIGYGFSFGTALRFKRQIRTNL